LHIFIEYCISSKNFRRSELKFDSRSEISYHHSSILFLVKLCVLYQNLSILYSIVRIWSYFSFQLIFHNCLFYRYIDKTRKRNHRKESLRPGNSSCRVVVKLGTLVWRHGIIRRNERIRFWRRVANGCR